MSAQVTEAHIDLAEIVFVSHESKTIEDVATLIADSEAKAVAAVNASLDAAIIRAWGISAERDQLRAERNNLRADLDAIKAIRDEETARAERAEAELANIRVLADRRNKSDHSQDTTHQLVAALDQALDIAQAELAQFRELDAERARMRQIAVDKRIRTPTPRTDEEAGSLIDAEEVVPADFARELEREVAAERARLDWLLLDVVSRFDNAYYNRAAIDAAINLLTRQ